MPLVPTMISAAISARQPKPRPLRSPVMMLGNAPGRTTSQTTRAFDAPSESAARCSSIGTERTPSTVFSTTGKSTV